MSSLVKDENYISIQGWMRTKLKLKNNDLLVYAIIYGHSQAKSGRFTGSLQYLANWCGATKQGILKNLKSLINRGLIKKEIITVNDIENVTYIAVDLQEVENQQQENKVKQGTKQSLIPVKQSLNNNIDNNIVNTKEYNTINSIIGNFEDATTLADMINWYTDDEYLRKLLYRFYNYIKKTYKIDGKQLYLNQFKIRLKDLSEYYSTVEEKIKIVEKALNRGWLWIYAPNEYKSNKSMCCDKNGVFQDNISPDTRDHSGEEFRVVDEGF